MQLTTDRLILREFVEADWPAVLAYQRDPRYLRYTHWIDRSPQDVQQFVQMFLSQQFALPRTKFQLAVTLKDTQRLIGNCGIRLKAVDALEADMSALSGLVNQILPLLVSLDAKAGPLDAKNKKSLKTLSGLLQSSAEKTLLDQITGPTPQGSSSSPTPPPPTP